MSAPLCLILTRHAHANWDDPLGDDHARTLSPRGRDEARRIGSWLARHERYPDAALVSSSCRTRETWEIIASMQPAPCTPDITAALYQAGPGVMLRQLRKAEGCCVLMLGHNPGVGTLARLLLRNPPQHGSFTHYPPCSTLVAEFDLPHWRALQPCTGSLIDFVVPSDLKETDGPST